MVDISQGTMCCDNRLRTTNLSLCIILLDCFERKLHVDAITSILQRPQSADGRNTFNFGRSVRDDIDRYTSTTLHSPCSVGFRLLSNSPIKSPFCVIICLLNEINSK